MSWFKRKKKPEQEVIPPKMPKPGGEWLEKFNDRKPDILAALNDKVKGCENNYKLFDGFI